MFKIIDLLNGQTVIDQLDSNYIENIFSKSIAIEHYEGYPQNFWLSDDAASGLNQDEKVFKKLTQYVNQYSKFFDANNNAIVDLNERGCYFGFERIDEEADFHISGTITRENVPVPALRVTIYDEDLAVDDFCGFAFTNDRGLFKISFNKEDFKSDNLIDFEGLPELYFEISELDLKTGYFQQIKRVNLPKTDNTEIIFNLDL